MFLSGFNFWSYVLFCFSHCGGYFPWVISLYTELYDLHFIIWQSELPGKPVCFSVCRHEKAICPGEEEITKRMWNHDSPGNFLSNCSSVYISYNISSYELGLSCTLHAKKKTNGKIKYYTLTDFNCIFTVNVFKIIPDHFALGTSICSSGDCICISTVWSQMKTKRKQI